MNDSARPKLNKIIGGEFAVVPEDLKGALDVRGLLDHDIVSSTAAENFPDDSSDNSELFFSSGRAALYAALCTEKNQRPFSEELCSEETQAPLHLASCTENMQVPFKVALPDYLCSSVIDAVNDAGLAYSFYHIEDNLYPDMDSLLALVCTKEDSRFKEDARSKNDSGLQNYPRSKAAIILINYFGLLDLDETIEAIRKQVPKAIIILDDVQNYYGLGTETDYDYAFTSLRKWFPMPDGGILKVKNKAKSKQLSEIYDSMKDSNLFVSYKLSGNLLKNFREVINDEVCLELIKKGEELLDHNYKCRISDISYNLFNTYIKKEQESAENRRKDNARYLHEGLLKLNVKHIYKESKVPLFIPVLLAPDKRDVVRKKMFDNNIFCPVHWKKAKESDLSTGSNILYDMELSLICDQRYNLSDMDRILEILGQAF